MKNQKYLEELVEKGFQVKNIDLNGNVRFHNDHSCGYPQSNFEPEFFWVENRELKQLADNI